MSFKNILSYATIFYDRRRIDFFHTNNKPADCEITDSSKMQYDGLFKKFIKGNRTKLSFVSDDPLGDFSRFSSYFIHLEAAGGLVINNEQQWLFIMRNGRWDLPKGLIEPGENAREAAIREVGEECGLQGLDITRQLPVTYHVYPLKNKQWALKRTHWFMMHASSDLSLTPQAIEGITLAAWRNPLDIADIRKSTYGNINELIDHCLSLRMSDQSHRG